MNMETVINQQNIQKLMDIFYAKVRKDPELSKIFLPAVGEDNESWEKHKEKIGRFWRQMLLGEPVFDGQPLKKHLDLPPFPRELFNVWLNLFSESLHQIYENDVAKSILQKATMIAQRFQIAIYDMQIHG
ncbi:group III truncated hemoglobin [Helicobacter anatolicus]|uniref:group III truncated hemoglobin n=1 Tax=Helicobacter anatolicus TaxID=2905874 RepID=UPI001E43E785|nr:group III truncated hemoglobin [Helicobacter anatolicus]